MPCNSVGRIGCIGCWGKIGDVEGNLEGTEQEEAKSVEWNQSEKKKNERQD